MFRNYLIAALRNLARNRLYAAINIGGLAIGFATAMLIALFVRDEFSYDSFIAGHDRTYLVQAYEMVPTHTPFYSDHSPASVAAALKSDFPQVQAVARVMTDRSPALRHGDVENVENVYWADPNIFDLLPLSATAGDLRLALEYPNSIVLTQKMARKYFGRDDALGQIVELNRLHPMTVTAILKDLPSNTNLAAEFFASGRAPFSPLVQFDAAPPSLLLQVATYLRLSQGASAQKLQESFPAFINRHFPKFPSAKGFKEIFTLLPIDKIHLSSADFRLTKPHGHIETIYALSVIGMLIVAAASINFVNLMTARAARRAVEVGIRKVHGATRRSLVFQFIGETLIYVALGTLLAMALVELLLPAFNAFLDRTITFEWWKDSAEIGSILFLVLIVGGLAGCYPAFILSASNPAAVVKHGSGPAPGSSRIRQILVTVQCATMIGLMLVAAITYRQIEFALNEGMRIDKDEVLVIEGCRGALTDAIARLPDVRGATCASAVTMEHGGDLLRNVVLPNGSKMHISRRSVGFGFFEFYGLRPLAGRFFAPDHPGDAVSGNPRMPMSAPVVINEAATRTFGFATPASAIGHTVLLPQIRKETLPSEIIGVVPDFSMDSIHTEIPPAVYVVNPPGWAFLNVKLDGKKIPETLHSIDGLWNELGPPRPIVRYFLDTHLQSLYRDIFQQGQLFSAFAIVALIIAALGLFGLAAFATERRTKEIGIRKALGASSGDVVWLLLWEFTKPVLSANLIAWPIVYLAMNRWLNGFAYHADLELWLFAAAGCVALVIAWLTVSTLSLLVARTKPIDALRYE